MDEGTRNLGIGLVIGGGVAGIFSGILYWLSYASKRSHHDGGPNIVLILFASVVALLAVYLIGYGIKKLVSAAS